MSLRDVTFERPQLGQLRIVFGHVDARSVLRGSRAQATNSAMSMTGFGQDAIQHP
jgi:hypothetical protein